MLKNNKIVIFGINGWVGKALLDYLFYKIKTPQKNLILISSSKKNISLISGKTFGCITYQEALQLSCRNVLFFHLAFKVKDHLLTTNIDIYKQENNDIKNKASQLIEHFRPNKMVYFSSGAVYNQDKTICRDFEKNPYGFLKAQDELFFQELSVSNNFPLLIPRIFNIAGDYINKHNIYAISDFIIQASQNNKIVINAKHPVIRSYIEIYDLIKIITSWVYDQYSNNFTFDTTNIENIELSDLAALIIKTLHLNAEIIRDGFDKNLENNYYVGNIENLNILTNKYQIDLQPHKTCIKHVYYYLKLKNII